MTEDILNILLKSGKASISEDWDALYQDDLPIVVAPSTAELDEATGRLDSVGGYGYIATWKINLFSFNPKLLSKAWQSGKEFILTLGKDSQKVFIQELQINVMTREALYVDLKSL